MVGTSEPGVIEPSVSGRMAPRPLAAPRSESWLVHAPDNPPVAAGVAKSSGGVRGPSERTSDSGKGPEASKNQRTRTLTLGVLLGKEDRQGP